MVSLLLRMFRDVRLFKSIGHHPMVLVFHRCTLATETSTTEVAIGFAWAGLSSVEGCGGAVACAAVLHVAIHGTMPSVCLVLFDQQQMSYLFVDVGFLAFIAPRSSKTCVVLSMLSSSWLSL